jgi:hypothetical protein
VDRVGRQHRTGGLATLEIVQTVRRHWGGLKSGRLGVLVVDAAGSEAKASR